MNRREKCRCISLILVFLLGVAGVTAMIYGSVHIFRVSKTLATQDGVANLLSPFFNCHDVATEIHAANSTVTVSNDVLKRVATHQCLARQVPTRIATGFAAAFMILALLCAPCAFRKDKWFGFTMWSTLAIATIVVSVVVVASITLPVAAHFENCKNYDSQTVSALSTMYDTVCLKGPGMPEKTSALKWLCKLCTFFAGAGVSIGSLLLLFMIKSCCCCNPNGGCGAAGTASGCGNGEHPCPIRRALCNFRSRFCRRTRATQQEELPVTAPTYYEVHSEAAEPEGVSEDAGVSPSSSQSYYGVN